MKTKRNETPAKTVDRRQKVHSELSLDFQSGVLLDLGAPRQGSFGQLRFTHSDIMWTKEWQSITNMVKQHGQHFTFVIENQISKMR